MGILNKIEEMKKKASVCITINDDGYDVQIWSKKDMKLTDFFITNTLEDAVGKSFDEYKKWESKSLV